MREWSLATAPSDRVQFREREDRLKYLAGTFGPILSGRVLDVGCDARHLKRLLPGLDYLGIDIAGDPDIVIDLEKVPALPFGDREFDLVICSEVLEHLDNLHHTFGELARVTKKRLLVSLPNCWSAARLPLRRGIGSIGHYGLPPLRPADRHKWFFSASEALAFGQSQGKVHGLGLVEIRVCERPRPTLVRVLRRIVHPYRERYMNRYAHTIWMSFERAGA